MKYVLDTNILSKAIGGRSREAADRLRAADPKGILLTTIVLAEIAYGIRGSIDPPAKRQRWKDFLEPFGRASFDEAAAELHADIRWQLRHQPIGDRDLIIAAIAMAHGATVVTNNRSEFDRVPGLAVEDWTRAGALD